MLHRLVFIPPTLLPRSNAPTYNKACRQWCNRPLNQHQYSFRQMRILWNSDNLNLTTREVTIVEDAFHIANVMRMTVGERIVVIAADNSYLVELTNINPKICVGQIIEELSFDNELKTKVTIAHAFVRREK